MSVSVRRGLGLLVLEIIIGCSNDSAPIQSTRSPNNGEAKVNSTENPDQKEDNSEENNEDKRSAEVENVNSPPNVNPDKIPEEESTQQEDKDSDSSELVGPSERLSRGLVGYWRFDTGMEEGSTPDSSGSGIAGLVEGGVTAGSNCRSGGCAAFNGGHINLGNPAILDFDHNQESTQYTIAAWIKTSKAGSIFAKRGSDIQYQLFVNNLQNGTVAAHIGTESNRYSSLAQVTNNMWRHVAMKVFHKESEGSAFVKFFVDGQASGGEQQITGTDTNNEDIWLGARPGGFVFSGMMDELTVYNRALQDDEIEELYRVIFPIKLK